jgi:hypothetical protein
MNITRNAKKELLALAAGLAAGMTPAVLFLGAGIGHADAEPEFQANAHMVVQYSTNPFGLNATIWDGLNPAGVTERCHYHSSGTGQTPPLPFDADAFPNGTEPASLFIPGMQLGGTWNVTVTCDHSGPFNFNETY